MSNQWQRRCTFIKLRNKSERRTRSARAGSTDICGGRRRGRSRHRIRIAPALLDPLVHDFGGLGVERPLTDHAAEALLDVRAGTTKPIVERELTHGGFGIVPKQQTDHPLTQPDTIWVDPPP